MKHYSICAPLKREPLCDLACDNIADFPNLVKSFVSDMTHGHVLSNHEFDLLARSLACVRCNGFVACYKHSVLTIYELVPNWDEPTIKEL